jgi:serine/threonine-protein kinase PknG
MNCVRPGCAGEIEDDGYCNTCGTKGDATVLTSATPEPAGETQRTRRSLSTRATTRATRRREEIVEIPPMPERDPRAAILENAQVPEERRYCGKCDAPVGRAREGMPGRTEGFCPQCGEPFFFTPKLVQGDLVAGQYEVAGPFAHGGLGWIYLAIDRNVENRWVVLKGLLNTADDDAREAALAERRSLAQVDHPSIVRIYNFVEHGDDGYIVMEYLGGRSLRGLLDDRRDANHGIYDPLPVDHAIWYMLQILPAFGYLHERGLLFCDFKPENVMLTGDSVKLIDLGGVYRMDDRTSAIYGTRGYQVPEAEIKLTGPTVATDLYTVARTLAVLCTEFRGYQMKYKESLPPREDVPLYTEYESLYRFLERATAPDPDDRFQSADDMAAQLFGVLREIVSAQKGKPVPGPSTLFTGEFPSSDDAPDWRTLPALLVATDDPAAGFLGSITTSDPDETAELLSQAPAQTVEVDLRRARTLIEAGRIEEAERALDQVAAADPWEWRTAWYRGLAALHDRDGAAALRAFEHVFRRVPGELAVKLAMAEAAGAADDQVSAAHWADVVSRTDPSITSAAFCLARARFALDDRPAAIAAYERVPQTSSAYIRAQIAKARTILHIDADGDDATAPTVDDVVAAAAVIDRLALGAEQRTRLSAEVLEAGLVALAADDRDNDGDRDPPVVFTYALDNRGVRLGLESAYRTLARQARSGDERIQLVKHANRVRPWTAL